MDAFTTVIVPQDYVCPICHRVFWSAGCKHTEWQIIQHLTNLLAIEQDAERDAPYSPSEDDCQK